MELPRKTFCEAKTLRRDRAKRFARPKRYVSAEKSVLHPENVTFSPSFSSDWVEHCRTDSISVPGVVDGTRRPDFPVGGGGIRKKPSKDREKQLFFRDKLANG